VVAELRAGAAYAAAGQGVAAGAQTIANRGALDQDAMAQTVQQSFAGAQTGVGVSTSPPPKKRFFSPVVLGISGLLVLFLIGVFGLGGAYMLGFFGGAKPGGNSNKTVQPTPAATPEAFKPELAAIPGGTFKMGRDKDGRPSEQPSHPVEVKPFKMDKTEITNAEYSAFISATSYRPVPAHWVNDKPIIGQERMPVRFVNMDDVNAFIAWRSKRDGVTYRLPTEDEWEYAARNGAKDNIYPWGDTFDAKCAVMDKDNTEPEPVGTMSCPDDWGVLDLIGNVFEWTSSKPSIYPGNKQFTIAPSKEPKFMVRGGGAKEKSTGEFGITSTFRLDVDANKRDIALGFRLVSQE
jgi:formylglycine-generating enzyme required for sulfatase activity